MGGSVELTLRRFVQGITSEGHYCRLYKTGREFHRKFAKLFEVEIKRGVYKIGFIPAKILFQVDN